MPRGRRPTEEVRTDVLAAAGRLLLSEGMERFTIERVDALSGEQGDVELSCSHVGHRASRSRRRLGVTSRWRHPPGTSATRPSAGRVDHGQSIAR